MRLNCARFTVTSPQRISEPERANLRCMAAGMSMPASVWRKMCSASCFNGGKVNDPGCEEPDFTASDRSEEHTSELQSLAYLVCRLLLEKKKKKKARTLITYISI